MHEELTTYRERALAKLRSALRRPADGTAWLDVFVNHERPLVRKGNEAASTHIAGAAPDRFLEHVRQRRSCGL